MTKPTPESGNSIERLLQDRSQFVSWLTKLNATGETTPAVPEAVRSRVRADYERRLDAVLEELRGHTASLEEQVEDLSTRAALLSGRENEHKEQLSEAEVRHLVGEYDEGKWDGIRAELMKVINQIRSELNHTTSEIERLNEVLATIRAPIPASSAAHPEPEPEPEPEAVLLLEPDPEPEIVLAPPPPPIVSAPRPGVTTSAPRPVVPPDPPIIKPEPLAPPPAPPVEPVRPAAAAAPGTSEIPFRQVPPRPQPKPPAAAPPKKDDQPSRTLWFPSGKPTEQGAGSGGKLDELAFLKSVTGNEAPAAAPQAQTPAPKPSRASGGFTKPPEAAPPMTTAPTPAVDPAAKAPAAEPKDRSTGSGQKTLKCGECGTLNRPTEWYCERCGAELAAL
jgi:hypothetical protein